MITLGIDPGLASTGYGLVERRGSCLLPVDWGVIETSAGDPTECRLAVLHERVCELLDRHQGDQVALESLYFGRNVKTAFDVGQARGVCLVAAGQCELPCTSYTPQQIKAAVCGHGGAGKQQVARMVKGLLGLAQAPASDHAADALAVAICHSNAYSLRSALSRSERRDNEPAE
jgi:crossover junction endodeoxyribonuclease RuvC